MSEQSLFVAGSLTSWEAAEAIKPVKPSLRKLVYSWLEEYGPATDREMQEGLEMDGSTQRPRRVELHRKGLVRVIGRVKQPNGRWATLWETV